MIAGVSLLFFPGAFCIGPVAAAPAGSDVKREPPSRTGKVEKPAANNENERVPAAKTATPQRVLEFPEKIPFGALYKETGSYSQPKRTFLCRARGRVPVPAGVRLGLVASYDLLNNFDLFKKLPPDAFYSVDLNRVDSVNDKPFDISALAGQRELRFIDNSETDMTDESVSAFKSLEHLQRLRLWYCGITGSTLDAVANIKTLEWLDLGLNQLSPAAWKAIGRMSHLKTLAVTRTGADDSALAEISKLQELDNLSICENKKISAKGLALLKNCKKLRTIDASRCNLSANDFVGLAGMKLDSLTISGRYMTKADLAKIHNALPRTIIGNKDVDDQNTNYLFSPLRF